MVFVKIIIINELNYDNGNGKDDTLGDDDDIVISNIWIKMIVELMIKSMIIKMINISWFSAKRQF